MVIFPHQLQNKVSYV